MVKPVCDALGFQRGTFTVYISIMGLVSALSMPVWGKLVPKIGIKAMVVASGAIAGIGLISMSYFTSLMPFYIAAFFVGMASTSASMLPASIVINNWFVEKRGLAMGLAMAFTGVSTAILSPIMVKVILKSGWGAAYMMLGIVYMVLTIPVGLFILKAHPAQAGLTAYGAKEQTAGQAGAGASLPGVSSSVAFKSGAFYITCFGLMLIGIAVMGFIPHMPAFYVGKGLTPTMAGSIMSIFALGLIVIKVCSGWLNDKLGTVNASVALLICGAVGLAAMTFISNYGSAIAVTVIYAIGVVFFTVMPPLLAGKMFGPKEFSVIYALMGCLGAMGCAIGAPVFGVIFDKTGAYTLALYGSAALVILAMIFIVAGAKASEKLPRS